MKKHRIRKIFLLFLIATAVFVFKYLKSIIGETFNHIENEIVFEASENLHLNTSIEGSGRVFCLIKTNQQYLNTNVGFSNNFFVIPSRILIITRLEL